MFCYIDESGGSALLLAEERRRWLTESVRQNGALAFAEAEKALKVSRMTLHRDLDVLSHQGILRKVRGGAVALAHDAPDLAALARPFAERQPVAASAKQAIARHLSRLLSDAHTLVLDASSTVFALAYPLSANLPRGERFVVTGGLPLFAELAKSRGGVRVALHGGEPHPRTGSLVGPLALASLEGMRFDWAVVSAVGLMESEGAVFDATPEEAEVKRAYLAHARKKALALDTTKLNVSGPYRLAGLAEFDACVTEEGLYLIQNGKRARVKK